MKNSILRLSLSLGFLFFSIILKGQSKTATRDETDLLPHELLDIEQNVSIIKLIANPDKFDGKRIQIIGFLHLEFEGNAIYLHKEDYSKGITENSMWVNFSQKLAKKIDPKKFNNKYVIIIGTFKAKDTGHRGLFGGTLDNIVRLDSWESFAHP